MNLNCRLYSDRITENVNRTEYQITKQALFPILFHSLVCHLRIDNRVTPYARYTYSRFRFHSPVMTAAFTTYIVSYFRFHWIGSHTHRPYFHRKHTNVKYLNDNLMCTVVHDARWPMGRRNFVTWTSNEHDTWAVSLNNLLLNTAEERKKAPHENIKKIKK